MADDDAGRFLDALFGSTEGVAWVSAKKLPNGKWLQGHGNWPAARKRMLATVRQHDDTGHEVYLCTTLRRPGTTDRQQGQAVELRWLHVDLDPDKGDTPRDGPTLDPALYRKLAPMRIASGSPGHEHAYIQLTEPIDLPRWKALQRALDQRLGGDHKLADNDVLRVPGTHHRKPGKPASLVQVIEWGGEPWDAAELAELLGVDMSAARPERVSTAQATTSRGPLPEATVEPPFDELDLLYSSDVERAWHNEIPKGNGQGADRSEVIFGLVKACQRAGYQLDDAIELALHYGPARAKWRHRAPIANDVRRIWEKPVTDELLDDDDKPRRRPRPSAQAPLYVDLSGLLKGGLPEPLRPTVLTRRRDGHCLFYPRRVNYLFGDPESGKTWVALAACAEVLVQGCPTDDLDGRALYIDLDHNGVDELVAHLVLLGVPLDVLADPDQFRIYEPEDAEHLDAIVDEACEWEPDVAVVDSVGELLPMLGLSSNSADDYTDANRRVNTPLAEAGAAVIAIDHLAKGAESRGQGATGTGAKRRAVGGVSLRVSLIRTFVEGRGGACALTVHKDRPGGLRKHCPDGHEPLAGVFTIEVDELLGHTSWAVWPARDDEAKAEQQRGGGLLVFLPHSGDDRGHRPLPRSWLRNRTMPFRRCSRPIPSTASS